MNSWSLLTSRICLFADYWRTALLPVGLKATGRDDVFCLGYVLGYVHLDVLPGAEPVVQHGGNVHGGLVSGRFTALVNLIEKFGECRERRSPRNIVGGRVWGGFGAWRHRRRVFWVFLPFVLCMCVSTVYVRNHYLADVFGGIVTERWVCIGVWVMGKQGAVTVRA